MRGIGGIGIAQSRPGPFPQYPLGPREKEESMKSKKPLILALVFAGLVATGCDKTDTNSGSTNAPATTEAPAKSTGDGATAAAPANGLPPGVGPIIDNGPDAPPPPSAPPAAASSDTLA